MARIKVEKEVNCVKCGNPIAVVIELYDCSPEEVNIDAKCTKCKCVCKLDKKNLLVLPEESAENEEDDSEEEGEMDDDTQEKTKDTVKSHNMNNDNMRYFG